MIAFLKLAIWGIHWLAVVFIFVYCTYLFILAIIKISRQNIKPKSFEFGELPWVTIQLPLYNERWVADELFTCIDQIQYSRLQIQILDDSTDQTLDISKKWYEKWREKGRDVELLHRTERVGFKAGALLHGLKRARGEMIAIFDADFRPAPDFLIRMVPFFHSPQIAAVQARWGYSNPNQNMLTVLQKLQLNIHFQIEQQAKFMQHLLIQFNGTCGIWRKSAIEQAGNWQSDTLTEDLDLSYRAQLVGYQLVYNVDVVVEGELPQEISGLKVQQHRWMKGGAETAKKLLSHLWHSKLSPVTKCIGSIHLLSSSVYIAVFAMVFTSFCIALFWADDPFINIPPEISYLPFVFFVVSMIIANLPDKKSIFSQLKHWLLFLIYLPAFMAFSLGLSYYNAIAAAEGWLGIKTPFLRTPKSGTQQIKKYTQSPFKSIRLVPELLMAMLCATCLLVEGKENPFFVFHTLGVIGYFSIFILTLHSQYIKNEDRQIDSEFSKSVEKKQ